MMVETTKKAVNPKADLSDASEGRTLFIRNLNFDTKEEDLKEFFEEFGDVLYAKVVKDRISERSRGTAFVKFREKAVTDDVLLQADEDPNQFELDGRVLNLCLALTRTDVPHAVSKPLNESREKKVGKRNLHLSRVGVILPGSKEAQGLSKAELEKRVVVEKTRVEKLKDPNTFVSPVRLCVRNLPTSVDDKRLRRIFIKAGGPNCRVMEARVMRDLSRVNGQGQAKSRGFGFVAFDEHSHALEALLKVNNSPDVFGAEKRPIVEFSIESRSALEKKARRFQNSQQKRKLNPNEEEVEEDEKSAKRRRKSDFLKSQLQEAPNKLKLPNAAPSLKVKQRKKNKHKTEAAAKKPKGKLSRKMARLKRKKTA